MKFRIFIMNQQLLPFTGRIQKSVKFYDSTGTLHQFNIDLEPTEFEFIENTIIIPETKNFGKWKIEVRVNNRIKSKEFEVQSLSKSGLEVFLDMPEILAYEDEKFIMKIFVQGENERYIDGTAKISLTKFFKNSKHSQSLIHVRNINLKGIKTALTLTFAEDLKILSPNDDMLLIFQVEVMDSSIQSPLRVQKTVELKCKEKYTIQVFKRSYFKPGFNFPIKIRVNNVNGMPVRSEINLLLIVEFKSKDGNILDKKTTTKKAINGVALDILHPGPTVHKIEVSVNLNGILHKEDIERFSSYGAREYMQVTLVKKR